MYSLAPSVFSLTPEDTGPVNPEVWPTRMSAHEAAEARVARRTSARLRPLRVNEIMVCLHPTLVAGRRESMSLGFLRAVWKTEGLGPPIHAKARRVQDSRPSLQ